MSDPVLYSAQYDGPVTVIDLDVDRKTFIEDLERGGGPYYCRVRVRDARRNVYATLPNEDLYFKGA